MKTIPAPFEKGVNFTNWLEYRPADRIVADMFGRQDFVNARKLGCDVIRLPIHFEKLCREEDGYAIPEKIKNKVAKAYNVTLFALGDETPDFLAAVTDLTAEACIKRNEMLTFPDGIYTQSVGSVMERPQKGQFPLNLSYRYVKNFDGDNDGLVGEGSFAWGEKYTLLRNDGKRGISHGDVIDLNRENIPGFDVRDFYTNLVRDLRERGL
jgi:hypothetical protein